MRCKQCLRVVRHPVTKSKILQICGLCRKHLGLVRPRAMLSDREKFVLHFVSMITIAKMTNMPNYKQTVRDYD